VNDETLQTDERFLNQVKRSRILRYDCVRVPVNKVLVANFPSDTQVLDWRVCGDEMLVKLISTSFDRVPEGGHIPRYPAWWVEHEVGIGDGWKFITEPEGQTWTKMRMTDDGLLLTALGHSTRLLPFFDPDRPTRSTLLLSVLVLGYTLTFVLAAIGVGFLFLAGL
jgi:hypothetical protein